MRIIGLTGGIATGKTTVSNYLSSKHGLPVLDADVYAKEAVAVNSPILQEIFNHFGDRVKLDDGSLNRSALGDIIFNDSKAKQWIESKIHPYVRDRFLDARSLGDETSPGSHRFTQELATIKQSTVVYAIPLLFEANLTHLVTEIWVVSCNKELQLSRLQKRNNLTLEQAQSRINNQLPLEEKIKQADFVLENNSTVEHLYQQCDQILLKSNK